MNPTFHTELSIKRNKLDQEDFDFFFKLHSFMDRSKELESSNLHRIFSHHLWFVRRVVIPIFGSTYKAKNGKVIDIKDDMEMNHINADFKNRWLPSLSDYISLCSYDINDQVLFENFRKENEELFQDEEISEFMYSPLANTGMVRSLFITHNSWMINELLPKVFPNKTIPVIKEISINPSMFFNRCKFVDWVNNGEGKEGPPSFEKIEKYRKDRVDKLLKKPVESVLYDGGRGGRILFADGGLPKPILVDNKPNIEEFTADTGNPFAKKIEENKD